MQQDLTVKEQHVCSVNPAIDKPGRETEDEKTKKTQLNKVSAASVEIFTEADISIKSWQR